MLLEALRNWIGELIHIAWYFKGVPGVMFMLSDFRENQDFPLTHFLKLYEHT